jgi:hypothetical protein
VAPDRAQAPEGDAVNELELLEKELHRAQEQAAAFWKAWESDRSFDSYRLQAKFWEGRASGLRAGIDSLKRTQIGH